VRELRHAMESAVVLGSGEMLFAEDLPEQIRVHAPAGGLNGGAYTQAIEHARRDVILKAFARAEYAHDAAARILGLHPTYLYKLMRRLDLTVGKG
jgi:DNA-binding NtrC family response regulator